VGQEQIGAPIAIVVGGVYAHTGLGFALFVKRNPSLDCNFLERSVTSIHISSIETGNESSITAAAQTRETFRGNAAAFKSPLFVRA
jgi:hypothetical protein